MAELLVKAIDAITPRGYKRGDCVVVRPDGHRWGKLEGPPRFRVVKLPGVPVRDLLYLTEPAYDADQFAAVGVLRDGAEATMRRAVSVTLLALEDRDYGLIEFTAHTRDKRTGVATTSGRITDG